MTTTIGIYKENNPQIRNKIINNKIEGSIITFLYCKI